MQELLLQLQTEIRSGRAHRRVPTEEGGGKLPKTPMLVQVTAVRVSPLPLPAELQRIKVGLIARWLVPPGPGVLRPEMDSYSFPFVMASWLSL